MEWFIKKLKYDNRACFDYFKTPLFKYLLNEILEYREIYLAAFGEFHFSTINGLANPPTQQIETVEQKISINQIALKSIYEGLQITRENADKIIEPYGHTSGEKLFQRYTFYSSTANRIGKPSPSTPTKLKNKIELFESVVKLVSKQNQQRIFDELNTLKTIQENEFE